MESGVRRGGDPTTRVGRRNVATSQIDLADAMVGRLNPKFQARSAV